MNILNRKGDICMSNINYFINSNSSDGFVSYYKSNICGLKSVCNLSSYPSLAAEDIIKSVIKRAKEAEIDAEIIHNCMDNGVEGVIIPLLGTAVINIPVYSCEYCCVGIPEKEPNLSACRENLNKAYAEFGEALKVHDQWEQIYLDNINFNALDELEQELEEKLIGDARLDKPAIVHDRFFGALTVNGSADYVDNITQGCKKRYFIKGRPGSGKSTIMKKLLKKASERGIDTDVYHCAFDPKSLDMLMLKDLDICIFDSTSPHEYFPTLKSDETVDVYEKAITAGTDEKYADKLENIKSEYNSHIAIAKKHLTSAHGYYEKLNRKYLDRMDYDELENIKNIILRKCFG